MRNHIVRSKMASLEGKIMISQTLEPLQRIAEENMKSIFFKRSPLNIVVQVHMWAGKIITQNYIFQDPNLMKGS